jgi:exodeoxyribonuclease VII large subunit
MQGDLFDTEPKALEVSELLLGIKQLFQPMPQVVVAGEVSNLTIAKSGHAYLTLKDDKAAIKVVAFRGVVSRAKFQMVQGMRLRVTGKLDVYVERGDLQFNAQDLSPEGIGALELAFRQRREKMEAMGWFSPERKRPIPGFPLRIGIVTSPTGSAIRDMLETIRERWPIARVILAPCLVQGNGSADQLARALGLLASIPPEKGGPPDVILLGRGGGSIEDLWSFNEEVLVRAVVACPIPIIAGVGHEDDVTLVDLAADLRGLTPTHAAQCATPRRADWAARIDSHIVRMRQIVESKKDELGRRLDHLSRRSAWQRPRDWVREKQNRVGELAVRLRQSCLQTLTGKFFQLDALRDRLSILNPLHVLERGYSLTCKVEGNASPALLRDASQVAPGDLLETRLARGVLLSRVERVLPGQDPDSDGVPSLGGCASPSGNEA